MPCRRPSPIRPIADREGRAMAFLELNGVSKGYGAGASRTEVLSDINLKVEEGEFIAIVGFSGSGKTTLMSLVAGLIAPDAGSVSLKGKPVTVPGPDPGQGAIGGGAGREKGRP